MKEIVILSGKGGTGKTSIAACLAALAGRTVLADCDVDAANLHLLAQPTVRQQADFVGGKKAVIRPDRCRRCGRCRSLCRFEAVEILEEMSDRRFRIQADFCEGCGVCVRFCPAGAVDLVDSISGRWFLSETRFGPMVHAQLDPAGENSGKLITLIRKQARTLALQEKINWILTDGAPGIGCPVIASMSGADFGLAVTEPSDSGLRDLQRLLDLAQHFRLPMFVCINKVDIHPQKARQVAQAVLGKILADPFEVPSDPAFLTAQIQGHSLMEHSPNSPAARAVLALWRQMNHQISDLQRKKLL